MRLVKRNFGAGGDDDEWIRRCHRYNLDPRKVFRNRYNDVFSVDILEETPNGLFRWRAGGKYFIKVTPEIDKPLEDYA